MYFKHSYKVYYLVYLHDAVKQRGVQLATGWGVRGSNPGGGEMFRTLTGWLFGPTNPLYSGKHASFLGVRRPGHDVDHPPPI